MSEDLKQKVVMTTSAIDIDERLAARQADLLELGATFQREMYTAYGDLSLARHEIKELRRERETRSLRTYSEEEVGVMLGVSEYTMASLRKQHLLPHTRAAKNGVRYSEEQARQVIERFAKNEPKAKHGAVK
jgi:hypothetical protein